MQNLPIDLSNPALLRLLLIPVTFLVFYLLSRLAQQIAGRSLADPKRVYLVNKAIRRTGLIAAAILSIVLLSPDIRGFITLLTVIGAGLAIALREALLSAFGWLRIALSSPYKVGDRIEINGVMGDVIDIRAVRTSLMEIRGWVDADQSTGRIVHVPNSWLWLHAVYNYSHGFSFIWNEIAYTLTFNSDWRAARNIISKFAEETAAIVEQQATKEIHAISREYLIHYSILTPFVYVRSVSNGVQLTLRYLCEVRKRRGTEHALTTTILDAFQEHGNIHMAYPAVQVSQGPAKPFDPMEAAIPPDSGKPGRTRRAGK